VVKFQLPADAPALPEPLRPGAKLDGANVEIATSDPTRTLYELTSWAVQAHISLAGLEVARPSLEDVYLEITEDVAAAGAKQ
jgi:ABC-2 type transport system ATP-binding protein